MSSGVKSDEWESVPYDKDLINNSIKLAKRDLETSEAVLEKESYDWAFSISYNAMLQAGRALMFSEGFRPKGEHKHLSVINFLRSRFNKDFDEKYFFMLNKIRKKRHIAVYEQIEIISKDEAEYTLKTAKEFVGIIEGMLNNYK